MIWFDIAPILAAIPDNLDIQKFTEYYQTASVDDDSANIYLRST